MLKSAFAEYNINALLITNTTNIKYLVDFEPSSCMLLIIKDKRYLIVDSRYYLEARQKVKLAEVIPMQGGRTLYNLLLTHNVRRLGFEAVHLTFEQYDFMTQSYKEIELVPVRNAVEKHRAIKAASELESLRTSAQIAEKAFDEILNFVKKGISEKSIEGELERQMKRFGAEMTAFKSIIVSGDRTALPHGLASDKIIEDGEILTLDYGCIYNGYCSDITRTIAVGSATEKQRVLYEIVCKAQRASVESLNPGVSGGKVDEAARNIIKDSGYGNFFRHGIGHGIGLEVHELPRLTEGSRDILKPGMIVCIEPGIYIEGFGGVRVEDMIHVTEDGHERLTKAPAHLIEI